MNSPLDLLGAGWRQTDRLMTLTTPAGANALLAETVRIDESLGSVTDHAGFRLDLTVLSTNAHHTLTQLLGQPVRLDLQTSASRHIRRPFHGHVTRVTRAGSDGGFARYRLTIEPWLSFLGHTRDNYLFQDKSVIEIIDEVLGDWRGRGKLVPEWRWQLADPAAYPKRGMTVQSQESDLAFVQRLLTEEGLFSWFEHAVGDDETLGRHTLVIADHNGAFQPNAQARVRFTQAGATLSEDSLDRWAGLRQLDATEHHAGSWDYRSLGTRPQGAESAVEQGAVPRVARWDDPGPYAWPTSAHGERRLGQQREARDARLKHYRGEGTVRSAAPGTTFTLADHPEHDRDVPEARHFLITAVTHHARNNLGMLSEAAAAPQGDFLPGAVDGKKAQKSTPEAVEFYRNELTAVRASIPWRPLATDAQGRERYPRPRGAGLLTAIVVGDGSPTHTDRDGRVRVQFPWQRGANAGARQAHPTGSDNAPADASLGVWLRVMTPVAGANWGGHFTPRPGQEVLVAFQHGDIDRPVIVGAAYNGEGQADAQGNRIGGGPMQASANAPAWFAGQDAEPHTHAASLSGLKTQQLDQSRQGQGGYNQLVFDDTPGEARLELATSEYQSRLQLGHLKQQQDNARLADRGHGGELATQGSLALRAGHGLLLSADARPNASGPHLDSREPVAQLQDADTLTHSLADLAAKQQAALPGDPAADQLPAHEHLRHAGEILAGTATQGNAAAGNGDLKATQGGTGSAAAWSEPRLHLAAPAGLAQVTPKAQILAAGSHLTIASGHDTNLIAQGHHSLAIKDGLALFTAGKATDKAKANTETETGIHLHAASGQVSVQSQSGKTTAAADKTVSLASTTSSLTASAQQKILATAQGACLKIEGGNIELHAPKKVEFKASQKNLTGPKSAAAASTSLPKAGELVTCPSSLAASCAQGVSAI